MGDIVLLDEHTINKIAAGEVVDRPASIVKEILENSIDAGANKIIVEIKNGGISYIKVTDNGKGFKSDDVELAFERHATSKIRKEEDLHSVLSMGFRGEALASIAAISKVVLTSKNIDENFGVKAVVEGGKALEETEVGCTTGTQITVKNLFYNTPVRYKFLKKDFTEAGYIEDAVTRIALANPAVSIKYINNGKIVFQTLGKNNVNDTVYDIFGKDIYNNLINVNYEYENMKVSGVIGAPCISRSTRSQQFTFVNSRYIKDKIISSAIDRACLQKYAIGKFAFTVLNLEILPKHIDVNVHPAKLEVKFDDESMVFEAIYHAVKNALEQDAISKSPFTIIKEEKKEQRIEINESFENPISKNDNVSSEIKVEEKQKVVNSVDNFNYEAPKIVENVFKPYVAEEIKEDIYDLSKKSEEIQNSKVEFSEISVENNDNNVVKEEISKNVEEKKKGPFDLYKYVGHIFDTYIIIQIDDKMYLIDQHAAHERYLYEQIKRDYMSKKSNTQILLLPLLIDLTQKEMDIFDKNIDMFERVGFDCEKFGDKTVKISGVPNIGYELDYKGVFLDIIDEIGGELKTHHTEREDRFIATLACKAAVKGNMKLSYEEQIELVDKMSTLENPFNCPHGRPTAFSMTKYEVERRFLRK